MIRLVKTGFEDDNYLNVLPRGAQEVERLNKQHRFFPKNLGYLVHPMISPSLAKPDPWVADIGCGTGIYLLELAKELPSTAVLHGFDISGAQFPHCDAGRTSNVNFSVTDAKTGFENEHLGRYDMVHLRLLSPGMLCLEDWTAVARNAMSLLKPGGALQWYEESSDDNLAVYSQGPNSNPELVRLLHSVWDAIRTHYSMKGQQNPFSYFSTVNLPAILATVGAINVHREIVEFTRLPEMRTPWTLNMIECMRGVAQRIFDTGGHIESYEPEELDDVFAVMLELAARGEVYLRSDIHVHVCFKARSSQAVAMRFKQSFRARL